MPIRKVKWYNFWFNRYLLDKINNITPEFLKRLNSDDRKNLRKVDAFIKDGSLEEKLDMLGRMGVRFALVVVDASRQKSGAEHYNRLIKIFRGKTKYDKRETINDLKDMGLFVMTDADFVASMAATGHVLNSAAFNEINSAIVDHGNLFSYGKTMLDFKKHGKAIADIDRLIKNIMRISTSDAELRAFKIAFGIDFSMYRLLAELSAKRTVRHSYVKGMFNIPALKNTVETLTEKQMISADRDGKEVVYSITGVGQIVLANTRKYFLDSLHKIDKE